MRVKMNNNKSCVQKFWDQHEKKQKIFSLDDTLDCTLEMSSLARQEDLCCLLKYFLAQG